MRRRPLPRLAVVPAVLAALACGLAGCTDEAGVARGDQATADACAEVSAAVAEAMDRFAAVDPADPAEARDAVEGVAAALRSAAASVDNAAVEDAVAALGSAAGDFADALGGVVEGDLVRATELAEATEAMRGAARSFTRLCAD